LNHDIIQPYFYKGVFSNIPLFYKGENGTAKIMLYTDTGVPKMARLGNIEK